jgi:hypothetical protein
LGLPFPLLRVWIDFEKMCWATFWAIFSQIDLVTQKSITRTGDRLAATHARWGPRTHVLFGNQDSEWSANIKLKEAFIQHNGLFTQTGIFSVGFGCRIRHRTKNRIIPIFGCGCRIYTENHCPCKSALSCDIKIPLRPFASCEMYVTNFKMIF